MSCSRTTDYLADASKRVYALEQQLLSWRKILHDFPEQPTFADLREVIRSGADVYVLWFNEADRFYDVQESFDGISWYPTASNSPFNVWFGPSSAPYFRVIRRPHVIVDCELPYNLDVSHTRFYTEIIGYSGGCYDPVHDEASCEGAN